MNGVVREGARWGEPGEPSDCEPFAALFQGCGWRGGVGGGTVLEGLAGKVERYGAEAERGVADSAGGVRTDRLPPQLMARPAAALFVHVVAVFDSPFFFIIFIIIIIIIIIVVVVVVVVVVIILLYLFCFVFFALFSFVLFSLFLFVFVFLLFISDSHPHFTFTITMPSAFALPRPPPPSPTLTPLECPHTHIRRSDTHTHTHTHTRTRTQHACSIWRKPVADSIPLDLCLATILSSVGRSM